MEEQQDFSEMMTAFGYGNNGPLRGGGTHDGDLVGEGLHTPRLAASRVLRSSHVPQTTGSNISGGAPSESEGTGGTDQGQQTKQQEKKAWTLAWTPKEDKRLEELLKQNDRPRNNQKLAEILNKEFPDGKEKTADAVRGRRFVLRHRSDTNKTVLDCVGDSPLPAGNESFSEHSLADDEPTSHVDPFTEPAQGAQHNAGLPATSQNIDSDFQLLDEIYASATTLQPPIQQPLTLPSYLVRHSQQPTNHMDPHPYTLDNGRLDPALGGTPQDGNSSSTQAMYPQNETFRRQAETIYLQAETIHRQNEIIHRQDMELAAFRAGPPSGDHVNRT